ncbi:MAG: hypothetical protein IPM66_00245 [Acidobacteriota bacterium]|nr:MAG: hypothetical protein IPM66_00245 [Acidobacteriota bacterium]
MRIIRISSLALALAVALAAGFILGASRTSSSAAQDEPLRVKGGSLIIECPSNADCLGNSGRIEKDKRGRDKHMRTVSNGRISQIRVLDSNDNEVFNRSDLGRTPTVEIFFR